MDRQRENIREYFGNFYGENLLLIFLILKIILKTTYTSVLIPFVIVIIIRGAYGNFKKISFVKLLLEDEGFFYAFLALINILLIILGFLYENVFYLLFVRAIFEIESFAIQDRIIREGFESIREGRGLGEISALARPETVRNLKGLVLFDKTFEESLREKIENERIKTEFITNITHDIKTPLTSIINYTDILAKKEEMDEEAKAYINILGRNSQRMKDLIVDMLEASKAASRNVKVEKNFIEFNELFLQIYGDFDDQFVKKSLELKYNSDEENIYMYTDGNILSRIMQNLLSNINKYARVGTNVEVDVKSKEDLEIKISNISNRKFDEKDVILEDAFVKFDKSRNTDGSGLGLYITKNLVELLGGKFNIHLKDDIFTAEVMIKK